jgi:LPS-assembly protein
MNLRTIITSLLLSYVWVSPLYGQKIRKSDANQPALYYADAQTYDRELGILILKGNVEFEHEGSVLEADYVTYNENTDIVTASGNVRLRQPDGDINFAEYVELTGDMKKGIILQLRTLMEDNSKIAALEGRKFEDHEELDQAVYTPCEFCDGKPPTWQINARRAVKDDVKKNIYFTDAEMRILNVPILYTPFATQPLERRSGFLIPQPDYNSTLGASIEVPYYLVLSDDIDMTLSPTFFTEKNPLFGGQYRQAFGNGALTLDGSITDYKKSKEDKKQEKKQKFEIPNRRGYFLGSAKFNFNNIWRVKLSGGTVSDRTFFKKFGYSGWKSQPALTSKGILEGFLNQRDYAAAKIYHFQGLQNADKQDHIAAPLPYLEYNAYSAVDPLGGRFNFNTNFLNLYRESGINYQRGIGEMSWQRPWVANLGQVFTIFASTRGDLYSVEHSKLDRNSRERKKNKDKDKRMEHAKKENRRLRKKKGGARFFPQTGLNWRWPFINAFYDQSVVLQPVGQIIAAPDTPLGVKSRRIPDEDSADFSFNDANLFSWDRFPGYDLIDTGSRAIYGGEILTTGDLFGDVEVFLGQSYSLSKPKHQDKSQGFGRRPSDYVGRVEASPFSWLTLNYRFRLDQKSWNTRISEVGGSIGPDIAKLAGDYVFISKHAGTQNKKDFNQISLTLSSKITKYWTLIGMLRQDLNHTERVGKTKKKVGGGPLEQGIGIAYRDDCFGLGLSIKRQYYKDRDLRPATIATVTLFLKNIGDYSYTRNLSQGLFGERAAKDLTL